MTDRLMSTPAAPLEEKGETKEMMFPLAFATLFYKGVGLFADLQRSALDLCAHQTADAAYGSGECLLQTIKLIDMAEQGFGRLIEMQKGMMDFMVKQSASGVDGFTQGRL